MKRNCQGVGVYLKFCLYIPFFDPLYGSFSEKGLQYLFWNERESLVEKGAGEFFELPLKEGVVKGYFQGNALEKKVLFKWMEQLVHELAFYFKGSGKKFTIPLDMEGTDFQKSVWNYLENIPFGETMTYGNVARSLERPLSARAVGTACKKNPLCLIIPCHRVIPAHSKGSFWGEYSGGVLNKEWLLTHEARSLKRAFKNDP